MRLQLGLADLARMTFAAATPYCELAVSVQVLKQPASQFRRLWRSRRVPFPVKARRLHDLIPAYGSVPTFLAPEDCSDLDQALEKVLSTPAKQIRTELSELRWATTPSPWVHDLARGRRDALEDLADALRVYHDEVFAPLWPSIQKVASAELTARARQLAVHGSEATLNSLHPQIRWRDGALDVHAPGQQFIDLDGRGLRLMPSIWTRSAVPAAWQRPTLVFPIRPASWAQLSGQNHHDRLGAVLGATRARVLQVLTTEHTTSELARAVGISAASASTHASALRGAGMVVTRRDGAAVRHVLTDLGRAVATANPSGAEPAAFPGSGDRLVNGR